MSAIDRPLIRVAAVVPFPEGGGDEILVLHAGDTATLPTGELGARERVAEAAVRIVHAQAGFEPQPERIVYFLERSEGGLTIGVLCHLPLDLDDTVDLKGEFVSLSRSDLALEPIALREILMEDLRSGFVRPVAHLVEATGESGPNVQITW